MRAIIDKYAGRPFDYESDCCRFVGECLAALGGENPIAGLEYRTERQAYRIIRQFGGLRSAVRHYLGEPLPLPLPNTAPAHGDVCLINAGDGREALGICYVCNGRARIVARTPGGLMDYPTSRALAVWGT